MIKFSPEKKEKILLSFQGCYKNKVCYPSKIKNIFINVSAKEYNLFLFIRTTAKKGANKITCSQIKHKIGKKIITKKLTKFA